MSAYAKKLPWNIVYSETTDHHNRTGGFRFILYAILFEFKNTANANYASFFLWRSQQNF